MAMTGLIKSQAGGIDGASGQRGKEGGENPGSEEMPTRHGGSWAYGMKEK